MASLPARLGTPDGRPSNTSGLGPRRAGRPRKPAMVTVLAAKPPEHEGKCGPAAGGCLGDLFALLSQSHMMQLVGILIWRSKGPVRFVELQNALGISPNTLSARLKALVEAGLVTRTPYNTIPPRVDYEATPKAHALKRVFKALHEWSTEHDLKPVAAPNA